MELEREPDPCRVYSNAFADSCKVEKLFGPGQVFVRDVAPLMEFETAFFDGFTRTWTWTTI